MEREKIKKIMFNLYSTPKIITKIFPQFIWETTNNTVLLTIDDSPTEKGTYIILNILKKNNIKALFFVTGQQAEKYPNVITEICNNGHLIGNHSYSHKSFMFLNKNVILDEIDKTNKIIKDITGVNPIYFRPPYGHFRLFINKSNLKTVMWSIFPYDYKNNIKIIKFAVQKLTYGSIIVMHDNFKTENDIKRNFEYLLNITLQKGLIFGDPFTCLS